MQTNGAKGRKNDRLKKEKKEKEEDLTRVGTLIYNEKGVPAWIARPPRQVLAKSQEHNPGQGPLQVPFSFFFNRSFCQICHVGQGSEYHVTEHVTEHV